MEILLNNVGYNKEDLIVNIIIGSLYLLMWIFTMVIAVIVWVKVKWDNKIVLAFVILLNITLILFIATISINISMNLGKRYQMYFKILKKMIPLIFFEIAISVNLN